MDKLNKLIKTAKAAGLWLLQGLIGAVIAAFFAYMFVEWAVGCGETYTDSKGNVHANECVWKSGGGTPDKK